jgi:hypothetical protein
LQLHPLSTTTAVAPMGGAYYGTPLALHQAAVAAAGSSSQYQFHHPNKHGSSGEISQAEADAIKSKIMAHPQYSALLAAYLDCQKVHIYARQNRKIRLIPQSRLYKQA